jgi:hypothetical protein
MCKRKEPGNFPPPAPPLVVPDIDLSKNLLLTQILAFEDRLYWMVRFNLIFYVLLIVIGLFLFSIGIFGIVSNSTPELKMLLGLISSIIGMLLLTTILRLDKVRTVWIIIKQISRSKAILTGYAFQLESIKANSSILKREDLENLLAQIEQMMKNTVDQLDNPFEIDE